MEYILIFYWWASGTPVLITERFETEEVCKTVGQTLERNLPFKNLSTNVTWQCARIKTIQP